MTFSIKVELNFDFLNENEMMATRHAIESLFNFIFKDAEIKDNKIYSDDIKKIWPYLLNHSLERITSCQYEIIILPLNRVGAQEGASGSKVFVTYFKSKELDSNTSSNPLIFKYSIVKGTEDSLEIEKKNADSVVSFTSENFAIPLYHSVHNGFSFLWAPFTSSIYPYINGINKRPILKENNLWKLMLSADNEDDVNKVNRIINGTYRYFEFWHKNNGHHFEKIKTYYKEYEWYLRDVNSWHKNWIGIWGGGE
ncbi:hypothetical protein Paes_0638 [Prosthecochloris aestuarii DSM 271]|uniref:Uncharacterized protein n=1 Tax=Prosthecochloris aestuarii (strain DSM 271 / SK 413) TaxID=290512 RepID=B4S639_PROA2|nr:hypothetical protein [Prosthecochloris aestuarii]ACF45690.1 hypothetical protein Paes_0638 [Prosthecochloris aestuarii DSM 271]